MNYIPQEDEQGCLIAALAMVFDTTYADVKRLVSVPKTIESQEEQVKRFVAQLGSEVFTLPDDPFLVDIGKRHIITIPAGLDGHSHALALDEQGTAFDPLNPDSRKHWTEYEVQQIFGFRPLSTPLG